MRTRIALAAFALVALLPGCESSQDKSARLAKNGGKAFQAKGLSVTRENANVKVTGTVVLHDQNGAAAVVLLHNAGSMMQLNVPVSIDVLGAGKKSVFKNDSPGLEPSLVSAPLLPPRSDFIWVNDQVTASGTPKSVLAKVGRASQRPGSFNPPKLVISPPTLKTDPVSGVEAVGTVTNQSHVEQRELFVYCVALRGKTVVAAGRSGIARLQPGKKKSYHVFFIGNPAGARLSLTAPPTVLQ